MLKLFLRTSLTLLFLTGTFAFPQWTYASANEVDVLISYAKPYGKLSDKIEAVGGSVRFQYQAIDALAATIPVNRVKEIQNLSGVRAFKRDITFSIGDPPGVDREGFGKIASRFEIDAAELSGDMKVFTVAEPDGYYPFEVNLTRALHFWNATGHFGEGVLIGIMDSGVADVAAISGRVRGGESFLYATPSLDDGLGPNNPGNEI